MFSRYEEGLNYGPNSSLNIFFYGVKLKSHPEILSYQADAISANTAITKSHFEDFHTYHLEWVPGDDGYIDWYLDDMFLYSIQREALHLTGSVIPEEPM